MNKSCLLLLLLAAAPATAAPPNVVFIMTDQHSADALSCRMGDKYLKTPALDGLAARGTYFSRAYAANPLCMPARNSIFTGRYPHETKVTDNTPATLDAGEFVNMGNYFRRAGYDTAYFGKWHLCYDEKAPETHGFTTLRTKGLDAVNADEAAKFLRRPHDRPFLLVVSFLNPHNVCELARGQELNNGPIGEPPPPSQLPPVPANLAPPRNEPDSMTRIRAGYHANPQFPVGGFSPEMWQALRWGYYRLIEKVDAEIGMVLTALRTAGLEDNTVIVFTADHGECAGAHGLNQKTVFYEESARVPLIVSAPGARGAQTSDRLVNVGVDLLPTMLDFARVERSAKLSGRSLRPLVAGETVAGWREYTVIQNNMTQAATVDGTVPMTEGRMVRGEQYKYCVYAYGERRESLVDLQKDPGEMTDLAAEPAYRAVLLEHRERLRTFASEHHDGLVTTLLADDVKPRPFPVVTRPKNARAIERLKKRAQ
ncbi:MAG: sulfatase-like hydrolase/transferase [Opitutaceae bacterium]|nr:sulfatase-like hydrolase/transferase [Opitutaceae bacterium]